MTFTDAERDFLGQSALGRIATTSADHVPDVAPVTYVLDGDELVVGGMDITKTRKYHNVLATGTAAFVVDELVSTKPWRPRGVKVTGTAGITGTGAGASIRISPRTVWSWGLNQGAETRFGPVEKRTVAPDGPRPPDGAAEG